MMLYPLRFEPILKEAIWGCNKLYAAGKKPLRNQDTNHLGESWELSTVDGSATTVRNGHLAGNTLDEVIEVFMDELVGEKAYERFGLEFPVLLKFIAPGQRLSLQVHPNDEFAAEYHGQTGKTELWYVVDAEPDGYIMLDWKRPLSEEEFDHLTDHHPNEIEHLINRIPVKRGDTFFIPPGTIHSLGGGVVVAEVQQTSTLTYRIYDWERKDKNGFPRELHTALAAEVIQLTPQQGLCLTQPPKTNQFVELCRCDHFCVKLLQVEGSMTIDYEAVDSFVAYMCTEGSVEISYGGSTEKIGKLESLLVPAEAGEVSIKGSGTLLEITLP